MTSDCTVSTVTGSTCLFEIKLWRIFFLPFPIKKGEGQGESCVTLKLWRTCLKEGQCVLQWKYPMLFKSLRIPFQLLERTFYCSYGQSTFPEHVPLTSLTPFLQVSDLSCFSNVFLPQHGFRPYGKTRLGIQDWLQIPSILSSTVIDKNEDGWDVTQDVGVLVWWRDVEQSRFPHISVIVSQFLSFPFPCQCNNWTCVLFSDNTLQYLDKKFTIRDKTKPKGNTQHYDDQE